MLKQVLIHVFMIKYNNVAVIFVVIKDQFAFNFSPKYFYVVYYQWASGGSPAHFAVLILSRALSLAIHNDRQTDMEWTR